jgi:hypothetical protein
MLQQALEGYKKAFRLEHTETLRIVEILGHFTSIKESLPRQKRFTNRLNISGLRPELAKNIK